MPYNDLDDEGEVKGVFLGLIGLAVLIALVLFLSSCTVGYATDGTTKTFVGAVGGKGAAKSGQLAMNWDNEKSFNDVAWVALTAIPAIQAVKSVQATEATARTVNTNATNQAINATNAAAATEQLGIKTAADVTKHVTLPK